MILEVHGAKFGLALANAFGEDAKLTFIDGPAGATVLTAPP